MKQHFTDEKQVSATPCREIIICPTLHYPPKNKLKSAFGDSGTCSISRLIAKVFIRLCSQNAN